MSISRKAALTLAQVSHAFGKQQVLRDISLTIAEGEISCLLGQSGCGKSTLLRLIAGIEQPSKGEILGPSQPWSKDGVFVAPEARKIGFMFQDYALFPHLNVAQNIAFGLDRLPKAEVKNRVMEIAAQIGVTPLLERYPDVLSGGEQQRVALARALAPRPELILMDEPFSNLDQGLRERVRARTLEILRNLKTTAIIVTHDPQEALAMGDQIVLMRAGAIEQIGTPFDLYDHPRTPYAAEFMGPCNRLTGLWRQGSLETPIGTFPGKLNLPEETLALACIRPQALTLGQVGEGVVGRILSKTFLGESEQIELSLHPLAEPLRMHSPHRIAAPIGAQVALSIQTDQVHLFVKE